MRLIIIILGVGLFNFGAYANEVTLPEKILRNTEILAQMIRADVISTSMYQQNKNEVDAENKIDIYKSEHSQGTDYVLGYFSAEHVSCQLIARIPKDPKAEAVLQSPFRCAYE